MTKDDIKGIAFESYLKGQEDLLEMLILATKKCKEAGQCFIQVDEALLVYNDWLKKVMDQYK